MHEGVKFECSHCEYKANRSCDLKTHIQAIHDGIKYKCKHCKYEAGSKQNLRAHNTALHKNKE